MVKITVCKTCGWTDGKIRRELKRIRLAHPHQVKIARKSCLDHCKHDPVVRVAEKTLAPARPKKLRRLVERALGQHAE